MLVSICPKIKDLIEDESITKCCGNNYKHSMSVEIIENILRYSNKNAYTILQECMKIFKIPTLRANENFQHIYCTLQDPKVRKNWDLFLSLLGVDKDEIYTIHYNSILIYCLNNYDKNSKYIIMDVMKNCEKNKVLTFGTLYSWFTHALEHSKDEEIINFFKDKIKDHPEVLKVLGEVE